jgi:hypothetical protein
MARRIAKTKAEDLGVFADRVEVSGTVSGEVAWGFGVWTRIHDLSLGEGLEKALRAILQGQGIPWKQYHDRRAAMNLGTPRTETRASVEIQENTKRLVPGDSGESGESVPPAPLSVTGGEEGAPALDEKAAKKAERAKALARQIAARQKAG